ncbi:MAG: hypothetical protein H8E53_09170, partial [Planctomycetes bacterium]|nr:hypothetical protein [Planctomycetota bacterium]
FPHGRGPQGDVIRICNFVRCVRSGAAKSRTTGPKVEMPQAPRRRGDGRPSFVKSLDKNGDGKVSKSEFDGPAGHFNQLDKNGDGYLSEKEAPRLPPPGHRDPPRR